MIDVDELWERARKLAAERETAVWGSTVAPANPSASEVVLTLVEMVNEELAEVDLPLRRAWSVKAGDRLLLEVEGEFSAEQYDAWSKHLEKHWPDVDVVIVSGMRVVEQASC